MNKIKSWDNIERITKIEIHVLEAMENPSDYQLLKLENCLELLDDIEKEKEKEFKEKLKNLCV
jgi:hypothetical protein